MLQLEMKPFPRKGHLEYCQPSSSHLIEYYACWHEHAKLGYTVTQCLHIDAYESRTMASPSAPVCVYLFARMYKVLQSKLLMCY